MRIYIKDRADILGEWQRNGVVEQLRLSLVPVAKQVVRVIVILRPADRRHRPAVRCLIKASGSPGWRAVVREEAQTALDALAAALRRLRPAVVRRLDLALAREARLRGHTLAWHRQPAASKLPVHPPARLRASETPSSGRDAA